MEHLLFHIIVETIQAIDRRLQRPLSTVIPESSRLKADPLVYLTRSPVQIGPRRRHAAATVCGLLAGIVVVMILAVLFANGPRPKRFDWSRLVGVLVSFVLVLLMVRSLVMRWLMGGTITLSAEGAELVYRSRSVFLPWPLFRAAGNIFEPDPKLAVLPIDPNVPVAVSGPDDQLEALLPAELELPQAASSDFGQLAIKDMYEVRISELAPLLHEIGRKVQGDVAEQITYPLSSVPLAVPQQDGWLCVQLTQLPFPPYCVGCGDPTTRTMDVPIVKIGHINKMAVPFCPNCAAARRRRRIIGAIIGLVIGVVVAVAVAGLIAAGNADMFVIVLIAFTPAMIIPGVIVGQAIGKDTRLPVRCRDYQPDKGTVRMQLRDPVRAAPLLHAMGLSLAAEPQREELLR